jgi:hypothetical protein
MNGELLTLFDLAGSAIKRSPLKSGIYFLFFEGEVVYVGRAIDVDCRVQAHKKKDYDSWTWVPCPARQQERLERAYLDKFLPPLNRDYNTELARRAAAHFIEPTPAHKIRMRGGRRTPRGCYWRKDTLWARMILDGNCSPRW